MKLAKDFNFWKNDMLLVFATQYFDEIGGWTLHTFSVLPSIKLRLDIMCCSSMINSEVDVSALVLIVWNYNFLNNCPDNDKAH